MFDALEALEKCLMRQGHVCCAGDVQQTTCGMLYVSVHSTVPFTQVIVFVAPKSHLWRMAMGWLRDFCSIIVQNIYAKVSDSSSLQ